MQLSKYFTLEQLIHSDTAKSKDIDNTPDVFSHENLKKLAARLDFLYDSIGPFRISSGYRSPDLNKEIGGSDNSYHSRGIAADIVPLNDSPERYFIKIVESNLVNQFGEIINEADEKGVIHVSLPTPEKTGVLMYMEDGSYYRYTQNQLDRLLGRNTSGSDSDDQPVKDTSMTDVEESYQSFSTMQMIAIAFSVSILVIIGLKLVSRGKPNDSK